MNTQEVMAKLKTFGTAQNRKIYGRHGVSGAMYGVSYANMGRLKREIKVDHALAESLWKTGNHDARVLATMIADPGRLRSSALDEWADDLENYVLTDAFAGLAARTAFAQSKFERWSKSKKEWLARAGWHVLNQLALEDNDLPDSYFEDCMETIEREIHSQKNRVKDAMNYALIAIGVRNSRLQEKAIAAAKRIGKVEVDHGETSCKTPDAVSYIEKTVRRRAKRKTNARAR